MEPSKNDTSPSPGVKSGIEGLTKDELITKYKGVLNLAKKAKQAKDELAEENRSLKEALLRSETQKEADKKALLTMKETLEQFTEQKLQMSIEVEELRRKNRTESETIEHLRIENESLRRQLDSLTTDNETLLNDIDTMENQLKKVNLIGMEQKKHLELLELEVNRLKERDCQMASLEQQLSVCLEENKALKAKELVDKKSLEDMSQKYQNAKEDNKEQRHKFNALKERFVDVYRRVKKLKDCKRILLETQHEYADAVSKWQNEIIQASRHLCEKMQNLEIENETLKEQLSCLRSKQGSDERNSFDLEFIKRNLQELNMLANDAMEEHKQQQNLMEEYSKKSVMENVNIEEVTAELESQKLCNRRLVQELNDLKVKLQDNDSTLNESANKARKMEDESVAKLEQLERENRTLQQKLESQLSKCEQLERSIANSSKGNDATDLENLTSELQMYRENYEDLRNRFELKERENSDLLCEMRELNEALKARGDLISRQEEKQQKLIAELKRNTTRLQQLEESLNDKENSIASKENELQQKNNEIQAGKNKVQRSEEHIAAISDELQSLKQGGINSDAQSDVLSMISTASRAEDLNRLREVDENYEERYQKLRSLAMKLKKKVQEQTAQTNELIQQLEDKEALQKELEECKAKLNELDEQRQLNETLQAENKKLKSSRKQANVLSLEIEAAERSLSEVSSKLNAKTTELIELNAALETKESTIVQLRKEIAILEASKASEFEHAKELKAQIDLLQSQIKDALHGKQTALDHSRDLEQAQKRCQEELEDLRLQLSQSASQQEEKLSQLHAENTELNSKLQELEATLFNTQSTLQSTTRSLDDLRTEYTEYKVKAQAVLRKNQTKDTTHERELEEELASLREKTQKLEAHAQTLGRKLEETEKQLESLEQDNSGLARRNNELQLQIEELRQQNDALLKEQRALLQAQQDTLRQQRQLLENNEVCHKEQIETIERNYQIQIEELKSEVAKVVRQPTIIGAVAKLQPTNHNNITSEHYKTNEILLMEREDAEGSEEANAALSALAAKRKISNASSSRRSLHDFMPLDELLNAPLNALNSETLLSGNNQTSNERNFEDNINANSANDSTEHFELLAAKERLQIQESRVRHLTALLAENEQDLAKLTQMNDMLKEELRRQERSVERESHMHNSEYLKNVFMKFLTLNSVDERTRLVPVLITILKLSREEAQLLDGVAKGQKLNETNARSWSNFLPLWGSGGSSGN